jgi:hypothetical protein
MTPALQRTQLPTFPSARPVRLSDAEHRQIEHDAEPRPRTATEWRQVADNTADNLIATEERLGWIELLLEDALRLLVRRQRDIDALQAAARADTLLIDTLLERTT